MPHVDFRQITTESYGPVPIDKYPCVVHVEWLKKDEAGNLMTGGDGQPARITTNAGDEMWNLTNYVMDGPHFDKPIYDSVSFGAKALKRAKIILIRAGMMPSDEECTKNPALWPMQNQEFQPEELDGTCWWVTIESHEARVNSDGTPKLSKAGKPLFKAKIAFDGYEPMKKDDAVLFRKNYLARKANQTPPPETAGDNGHGEMPF